MTIASELQAISNEIVARKQAKALEIERELAGIEQQKIQKQMELDATRAAVQRGFEFRAMFGPDHQCPFCFIEGKGGGTLRPIPSGEPSFDVFKCSGCQEEFRFLAP